MNQADFDARYELIEQVTEGVIETHHALHRSGVVVMVHFVSVPSLQDEVHRSVGRLQAAGADGPIVDVQRIDDKVVLITRFIMDFETLPKWFAALGAPMGEPPAFGETLSPRPGAGELTKLFAVESTEGEMTAADSSKEASGSDMGPSDEVSPESSRTVSQVEADPPAGPGEFTRMFEALPGGDRADAGGSPDLGADSHLPPAAESPNDPGPPPVAGSPSPSVPFDSTPVDRSTSQPGEFTRMFRVDGASEGRPATDSTDRPGSTSVPPGGSKESTPPAPGPERTDSSSVEAPGEFTQFFRGIQPGNRSDPPPDPSGSKPEEPSPPARPDAPKPDESFPWAGGDATKPDARGPDRMKGRDDGWADALRTEGRSMSASDRPADPLAEPDLPATPGEGGFTQIFGAQAPPPPSGSGPGPSASASSRGSGSPVGGPKPPGDGSRAATPQSAGAAPSAEGGVGAGAGGARPRMPRPRVPDPEALIRGARPRPPRVPSARVPSGRRVARAAVGAALARSGGAGEGEGEPASGGGQAPAKGLSTKAFAIGLAAILVISVVVVALLTLGSPGDGATAGDASADDAPVADSIGGAASDSIG